MRYDGKRRSRRYPKHTCACKGYKHDGNCLSDRHDQIEAGDFRTPPRRKPGRQRARWCGGHIGREHKYVWVKRTNPRSDTYIETCSTCSRQRNSCRGYNWVFDHFSRTGRMAYDFNCICGHHTVATVKEALRSSYGRNVLYVP